MVNLEQSLLLWLLHVGLWLWRRCQKLSNGSLVISCCSLKIYCPLIFVSLARTDLASFLAEHQLLYIMVHHLVLLLLLLQVELLRVVAE